MMTLLCMQSKVENSCMGTRYTGKMERHEDSWTLLQNSASLEEQMIKLKHQGIGHL